MSPRRKNLVALLAAVLVGLLGMLASWIADGSAAAPAPTETPGPKAAPSPTPAGPQPHREARLPPAPDAGPTRRLRFVAEGLPESAAYGLEVAVTRRCDEPGDAGSAAAEALARTDSAGVMVLAVAPDCELELRATDANIALREDDDGEVFVLKTGAVRVWVRDGAARPLMDVAVEAPAGPSRPPAARCTTGADGACELTCPKGASYRVRSSKPGFESTFSLVDCDSGDVAVTMQEGARRVTVTIEAPGSRLLAPLTISLGTGGYEERRVVDAPGAVVFEGCPRRELVVGLREAQRPFLSSTIPAGADDAQVTLGPLEPRRLDVWADRAEDNEFGFSPPPIDVRCDDKSRLLIDTARSPDGKHDFARLEYAPSGPCLVTRAQSDMGWDTDPGYETVQASPPAVVTLRKK